LQTIIGIVKEKVNKTLKSGIDGIVRDISKGKQNLQLDKSDASLYREVPKIEGGWQASGTYLNKPCQMHIAKYRQ